MTARVPISRQIGALVAEQSFVERRLRDAVARGRMRQAEMDWSLESFEAAVATLIWIRDNEATIRRVHAAAENGEEPA